MRKGTGDGLACPCPHRVGWMRKPEAAEFSAVYAQAYWNELARERRHLDSLFIDFRIWSGSVRIWCGVLGCSRKACRFVKLKPSCVRLCAQNCPLGVRFSFVAVARLRQDSTANCQLMALPFCLSISCRWGGGLDVLLSAFGGALPACHARQLLVTRLTGTSVPGVEKGPLLPGALEMFALAAGQLSEDCCGLLSPAAGKLL